MNDLEKSPSSPIPATPSPVPPKSKSLGCVSIIIGGISIVLFALSYVLADIVQNNKYRGFDWQIAYAFAENEEAINFFANLLLCLIPVFLMAGIIIGIISIAHKHSNKAVGIIGLAVNSLMLLLIGCIFLLLIWLGRTPL